MKHTLFHNQINGKPISLQNKQNDPDTQQVQRMLSELHEDNSLLYLIFSQSPNAIMITDAAVKIVYVNPSWERLTGYTFDEVQGKNPKIMQSGKTPHKVYEKIWTALKNNKPFITDAVINKKKDGTEYQILTAFFPIRKDGQTIFYVQTENDITEQKKLEEELKKSEESFRQLIDLAPDAIFIADINGKYTEVNNAAYEMLGWDSNEIIGKNISDLIPKKNVPNLLEQKKDLLKPGQIRKDEWLLKHKNGHFIPVEVSASILPDGRWLGFVREISKRKELEQQKDAFIGIASHELKTPLTSLSIYIQMLAKQVQKNEKNKPLINKINQQTKKMLNLINDLLDVSKINSGTLTLNLKQFDLKACVRNVVIELQQTTNTHKIVLSGKITKKVIGDKNKIEEVLENLLTNAIKYSPKAEKIQVYVTENKKEALVAVRDFGMGIVKKDQSNIFKRFYQTTGSKKGKISGFGLGLFIAREIIKQHKGEMCVESEIGKGSTFYFSLPLASAT